LGPQAGWNIPDSSIRAGLEATVIPGRFQILDQHKAQALGFSNARVILDGAHTEASANALACTLMEYFPTAKLALVVGMASDKDHFAFARSLLEEAQPHLVVTTRVSVAGSLERSTSGAELAQSWCQAAKSANMEVILQSVQQPFVDHRNQNLATHNVSRRTGSADKAAIMAQDYTAETQTPVGSKGSVVVLEAEKMEAAISTAAKYVEQRSDETQRIWVVCITGSLHGVATVLSLLP
jgi:folylpolyglutamate synthase/dihydropteroate synthase